jgi:hypothetical protein
MNSNKYKEYVIYLGRNIYVVTEFPVFNETQTYIILTSFFYPILSHLRTVFTWYTYL